MKHPVLFFLVLLTVGLHLVACAGGPPPEPKIVTQEVKVSVPVKCTPKIAPAPAYPDTDEAIAAAPDIFQLAKLYRAGRALRLPVETQLRAALKECEG